VTKGGRSPTGVTPPPRRNFSASHDRGWPGSVGDFLRMENHLCAGSPCNRSSDEAFYEVPTKQFHRGLRRQGVDQPGDGLPHREGCASSIADQAAARPASPRSGLVRNSVRGAGSLVEEPLAEDDGELCLCFDRHRNVNRTSIKMWDLAA